MRPTLTEAHWKKAGSLVQGWGAVQPFVPDNGGPVQMKVAVLSLALVGAHITTPVSGRMPDLNVEALCKARSADAKLMKFTEAQNVADCIRDEKDAKQQLDGIWPLTPASVRARCISESIALGTRGYLDLVTCIQIDTGTKSVPTASGGKKRETN